MRFTDPVPLRSTSSLASYVEARPIPHAYGRVTLAPIRYDPSGHLWILADHPIAGVDRVTIGGKPTDGWALQNGVDTTGAPIAVLETSQQVENPNDIAATIRGKLHPTTGALMENPAAVLWDAIANLCGFALSEAALDDLRSDAAAEGLSIGGLIEDPSASAQTALDRIAAGSGLWWGWGTSGTAGLWPQTVTEPERPRITQKNSANLRATTKAADLVTRLVLEYAFDYAARDYRAAMVLNVPEAVERFGEITKTIRVGWIRTAAAAEAYARRYLAYYSRPVWTVTATIDGPPVTPGDAIAISSPYSPLSAALTVATRQTELSQQLTAEAPLGTIQEARVVAYATGADPDAITAPRFDYQSGLVTIQILLPNTLDPAAGARVHIDNEQWLVADANGWIQFEATPGQHTLYVAPIGNATEPFEVPLTVA